MDDTPGAGGDWSQICLCLSCSVSLQTEVALQRECYLDLAPLAPRYLQCPAIFLGRDVAVLRITMQNIRVLVELFSRFSIK